ncbi:MAG: ABC transporter ATP-binding protein [Lentisphaerae bacterium]|nr:ABC transporter ATP-binding protein [Lentisphaerota bacterium]
MKSFIAQLRWLFTPRDKRKFIFIAVLMAFSALLELFGIGILLGAATVFLAPESGLGVTTTGILSRLFPGVPAQYHTALAISGIGLLLAAKNIVAVQIVHIQSKFIFTKRDELAKRLFKTYLCADYKNFSALSTDYCISSFSRLNDMGTLVLLPSMQVLSDILVIALLTVTAVYLYPVVSLSGIVFMLVIAAGVSAATAKANKKYGRQLIVHHIDENRILQAGITGKKTVLCAAKTEFFIEKFAVANRDLNRIYRKLYNLGQLPRLSLESASILLVTGVFSVMVILNVPKTDIMLTFAVLTAVIGRILPAMSRCHYNLTLIRQHSPLMKAICSDLRELPQEPEPSGIAANAAETIKFNNITFSYQDGKTIFDNFSLTIQPKTSLSIAGRSGRGKTTLIDLLLGLLNPDSGTITAGNVPINNDLAAWRRQIGIVPQNIFLLEGTVAENVAFGENNIDLEKVKRSLRLAGLSDFAPDFLLTAQGNLSGGQRQRIGIARALYHDAKLLILDEATSALDTDTENAFCEVLNGLKGKLTLIVISHRQSTLDACDEKLVL